MKAPTLVAAVILLGAATIFATRALARTVAPDGNPPAAPATASPSSPNQDIAGRYLRS